MYIYLGFDWLALFCMRIVNIGRITDAVAWNNELTKRNN